MPQTQALLGGSLYLVEKGRLLNDIFCENPHVESSRSIATSSFICILYVPAGTRDAYIAAGWTEEVFKGGIVEMEPIGIEPTLMPMQEGKDKNQKVFNLQGQRLGRMQRGVNIVNGKKILVNKQQEPYGSAISERECAGNNSGALFLMRLSTCWMNYKLWMSIRLISTTRNALPLNQPQTSQ